MFSYFWELPVKYNDFCDVRKSGCYEVMHTVNVWSVDLYARSQTAGETFLTHPPGARSSL